MRIAFTSIIYVIDLGLFVLVFVIIRSRRASPRVIAGIVLLAMAMYLASLALLVFISTHVSLNPTRHFGHMAKARTWLAQSGDGGGPHEPEHSLDSTSDVCYHNAITGRGGVLSWQISWCAACPSRCSNRSSN